MWPFSPFCIFMVKICFKFIAESLFLSCMTGHSPCSFFFLIALLKEPAVGQQGLSVTLNNKLCFNIIQILFFLFYIPKPLFNKLTKKFSFLPSSSASLSWRAAEITGFCCCFLSFWKRKWIYLIYSFIDCQNTYEVSKYIRCVLILF